MVTAAFIVLLTSCSIMALAWVAALKLNFLSLVDVIWAYGVLLCVVIFTHFGDAPRFRLALGLLLAAPWSLRLGTHLATRLAKHFPTEDKRYDQLKRDWQKNFVLKSFLFFQFQAVSQLILSFPFLATAFDPSETLRSSEGIGLVVSLFGVTGEAIADSQLKRFARDPQNRGQVCQTGLWKYSRHPNYFFEWITWCGFGIFGLGAPLGIFSLASPTIMLLLLLFMTGVPPAEESSLRSRGAAYRRYQETTSKFIPLPRRKPSV